MITYTALKNIKHAGGWYSYEPIRVKVSNDYNIDTILQEALSLLKEEDAGQVNIFGPKFALYMDSNGWIMHGITDYD